MRPRLDGTSKMLTPSTQRAMWLALLLLVGAPGAASAAGLSLSAGAGYGSGGQALRQTLELTLFERVALVQLELPVEYALPQGRLLRPPLEMRPSALGLRPGAKLFVPLLNVYVRGGYALGNLLGTGPVTHSAIAGLGWQLTLLEKVGGFVELTAEPELRPGRSFAAMVRLGALLSL